MEGVNKVANSVIDQFINPAVYLLSAFAFVWFLYGVALFIYHKKNGNTEGVSTGKRHMIWGMVGLIIIYSASAIYTFITGFFN